MRRASSPVTSASAACYSVRPSAAASAALCHTDPTRRLMPGCAVHACMHARARTDAFSQAHRRLGGLDMVFNNAGIGNEKHWKKMLDINLTAVIEGTYKVGDHRGRAGGVGWGHHDGAWPGLMCSS